MESVLYPLLYLVLSRIICVASFFMSLVNSASLFVILFGNVLVRIYFSLLFDYYVKTKEVK